MTDLRVIIREFAKGTPLREIERKLGLSRTSIRTYRERAEQSGRTMLELQSLEDAELLSSCPVMMPTEDVMRSDTNTFRTTSRNMPNK